MVGRRFLALLSVVVEKSLLILRHAKSDWADSSLADHDRPLNDRGKRAAPRMGRWLVERQLVPDHIVASTAVRAQSTAFAVMEATGYEGALVSTRRLYLAEPSAIIAVVQEIDDRVARALVVGHNPGLETLVSHLAGKPTALPTAALAAFVLPVDRWSAFDLGTSARKLGVWRPKHLPD